MNDQACWGIFREQAHSPGREGDDAEILRLTGKHLEALGHHVVLKGPEEIGPTCAERPRFIFLMCEQVEVLRRLRTLEVDGVPQVNSPQAVLNTYRDRMIATLEEAGVPFIPSRLVDTTVDAPPPLPYPLWVKRADVHNTQEGDVVCAADRAAFDGARRGLATRSITRAVLQPHVAGDLVKFYGIGTGGANREPGWFRWFYHRDQQLAHHPFDERAFARLVRQAAAALGLEVYGGDAIMPAAGGPVLLDLNAWPSFALFRDEAAERIAGYLAQRFAGDRR